MSLPIGLITLWKFSIFINNLMYKKLDSRTHNIVGEFAEHLVANVMNGEMEETSHGGYDIKADGKTVQVKARKGTEEDLKGTSLSDFHNKDFQILVIVLFNESGKITHVWEIPRDNIYFCEKNDKVLKLKQKDFFQKHQIIARRRTKAGETWTISLTKEVMKLASEIDKKQELSRKLRKQYPELCYFHAKP